MNPLQNDFPKTWSIIQQGIESGLHLGGQIYVSQRGRVLLDEAFGERAPGVAQRADDVMLWLSSSKPLTAVAMGQLLERGEVRLEDRVTRFIPDFGSRGKEAITIEHILTHTGGFRGADNLPEDLHWSERIARICETPIEADWVPGETAGYHMAGSWFVLGEILQRVTARTFTEYLRDAVLEPSGMDNTGFAFAAGARIERLAPMWITVTGKPESHALLNSDEYILEPRPGSNARGPIRELGRFYEMLLREGRGANAQILSAATVHELTRRRRVGLFDKTFQHLVDWGLGFIVNSNRYGPETLPYSFGRFASEPAFGHGGAQSSCGMADPAHALVVAWAFNGMPGGPRHNRRARELNSAIYEDLEIASG